MTEQYPGNRTRKQLGEQKTEYRVFFKSVLGVTSREQLLVGWYSF